MKKPYFQSVVHQLLGLFCIILLLFSASRLLLILIDSTAGMYEVATIIINGLRYDLRWSSLLILPLIFLIPLRHYLAPQHKRLLTNLYVHAVTGGLILLLAVDFFYYRYTYARLSLTILELMRPLSVAIKMVWQSYPVLWILILLVILHFATYRLYQCFVRCFGKFNYSAWGFPLLILFTAAFSWGSLRSYPLTWSDAWAGGNNGTFTINATESFFYGYYYHEENEPLLTGEPNIELLATQYRKDILRGAAMNAMKRSFQYAYGSDFNVVLILAESLSTHKTSLAGNALQATPMLQRIREEALYFPWCFTPHYGTARAVWSIFTGVPDVSWKYLSTHRIPPSGMRSSLNEIPFAGRMYLLGGDGTWADIKGFLHHTVSGIKFIDQSALRSKPTSVWGVDDDDLLTEADSLFRSQRQPFFAVVQTAGNHRPYTIPESADRRGFKRETVDRNTLLQNGFESLEEYNALRYLDFCIGRYFERAATAEYFRNTLFIIVGDHGNGGDASKLYGKRWNDYYLQMVHVPMLLYAPGSGLRGADSSYCSIMDIFPTIAQLKSITLSLGRNGHGTFSDSVRTGLFYMLHEARQMGWHSPYETYLKPVEKQKDLTQRLNPSDGKMHLDSLTIHSYRLYHRQMKK